MSELFQALKDIAMTNDGDIILDMSDVRYTRGVEWFIQEVNKILRSSNNEWFYAPSAGAHLERFYGENNTRAVAVNIEQTIKSKIERQKLNFPATLSVRAVPLSKSELKLYITLMYGNENIGVSSLVFDMQQGNLKETTDIISSQQPVTPIRNTYIKKFL